MYLRCIIKREEDSLRSVRFTALSEHSMYALILVILVAGTHPTSTSTPGFRSKESCEIAGEKAVRDLAKPDPGFARNTITVSYSCI
jgi:hypothetical protein